MNVALPDAETTPNFLEEVAHYRLLCVCEDCIHFDAETPELLDRGCTLGYPTSEHRAESLPNGRFVFCKSFEAT